MTRDEFWKRLFALMDADKFREALDFAGDHWDEVDPPFTHEEEGDFRTGWGHFLAMCIGESLHEDPNTPRAPDPDRDQGNDLDGTR